VAERAEAAGEGERMSWARRTPRRPRESAAWSIDAWHGASGLVPRKRNPKRRAARAAWRRNGQRGRRRA
jgi:hypothetical protein